MSIQLLAKDLYRLIQEVETLEAALAAAPPAERPALQERLRTARAEKEQLRSALEGSKG